MLLPLVLIAWAAYLFEREFYKIFGAYLVEVPDTDDKLLPSPSQRPRGFLERLSRS
jgi:hypothetical protein